MTTRVLLADDHQIVLDGLRMVVEQQLRLQVVGLATNGREAVRLARELQPDVAVVDAAMPELNGIEATRQILAEVPRVRVIALSMHSDKRYVLGMLKAGARGYLLKDSAAEELGRAITAVQNHQVYLSPAIAGVLIEPLTDATRPPATGLPSLACLSAREREVLQLLAEGRTARQIATTLFISIKTVETHRRQIMEKLELYSLAELTRYAIIEGLTTLEPIRRS